MCSLEHYTSIFTMCTELTDIQVIEQHVHTAKGLSMKNAGAEQGHFSPFLLFHFKSKLISLTGDPGPSYIRVT